ncbi:hypothetical protein QTI66_30695 [Variovorax sp. J22R133]|uniref:hypothetical protein n=1 Tax=Variovorax brevis TaxID=3053503 RepID=UPI002575693F|nr:hypothetical protein [Variovorax sp. J22R133]MDM0116518.1 hypothetical protein [Variovorax sp. J22R133]
MMNSNVKSQKLNAKLQQQQQRVLLREFLKDPLNAGVEREIVSTIFFPESREIGANIRMRAKQAGVRIETDGLRGISELMAPALGDLEKEPSLFCHFSSFYAVGDKINRSNLPVFEIKSEFLKNWYERNVHEGLSNFFFCSSKCYSMGFLIDCYASDPQIHGGSDRGIFEFRYWHET